MSEGRPSTTSNVSARMSRQRRRDTGPELALRRILHARGRRFRVDAPVPGMPRRRVDLLFKGPRLAVFVDGCFWHVCPEHATRPVNNAAWWEEKLRRNVERDRQTDAHLLMTGWTVVRIWEHVNAVEAADRVDQALDMIASRRSGGDEPRSLAGPGHGKNIARAGPGDVDQ